MHIFGQFVPFWKLVLGSIVVVTSVVLAIVRAQRRAKARAATSTSKQVGAPDASDPNAVTQTSTPSGALAAALAEATGSGSKPLPTAPAQAPPAPPSVPAIATRGYSGQDPPELPAFDKGEAADALKRSHRTPDVQMMAGISELFDMTKKNLRLSRFSWVGVCMVVIALSLGWVIKGYLDADDVDLARNVRSGTKKATANSVAEPDRSPSPNGPSNPCADCTVDDTGLEFKNGEFTGGKCFGGPQCDICRPHAAGDHIICR